MSIDVNVQNDLVIVTESSEDITVNVSNAAGPAGVGVPSGGSTGQVLKKLTNTDYDTYWALDGGGVPYSGATGDVNLGEFQLIAGQLTLDTTPTGTALVATTRWNDTAGITETTLKGGSVILKNGVDLVARVVNKVTPNTTLTKSNYQAVRVSGAQGQRLAVALAQANNDTNSADTIGLVTETIATNQEGFIMTMGQLENINTTGSLQGETWVDGDVLYLSPTTAGAITKVKPTGAGHIVVIGYVEYAHVNNGKIYVKVMNGWELDELHDVDIITPANNEALIYESSTALWKNKTIATALGYTPISGSGVTGQVAYWNGTNSQTGSNNLFWDAANSRLGIGTNVPLTRLHLSGDFGSEGAYIDRYTTQVAAAPVLVLRRSRGSVSVPSAVLSGDTLGVLGFRGYGATSFSDGSRAGIGVLATENWTDTSQGTLLGIFTTANGATTATYKMQVFPTGNLVLQNGGTFSDGGQRLQVYGDAFIKGSGATSATSALLVQNSAGTQLVRVYNAYQSGAYIGAEFGDGTLVGTNYFNILNGGAASIQTRFIDVNASDAMLSLNGGSGVGNTSLTQTRGSVLLGNQNYALTGATNNVAVCVAGNFVPTSGSAGFVDLFIRPAINQTGGANGITRGLYVSPTLTAAADWRSIEWSNNSGWGLYGAGTANNYLGGSLGIGSTPISKLTVLDTASTSASLTANAASHFNISRGITGATNLVFTILGTSPNTAALQHRHTNIDGIGYPIAINPVGGNVLIGTSTDATFKLDVNGTARVSGASTFGGNMTLSLNQNAVTSFKIQNITSGGASTSELQMQSDGSSGFGYLGKLSSSFTTYKLLTAGSTYIFNASSGNLVLQNDFATGSIVMAAGGSTTANMTIKSNGSVNYAPMATPGTASAGDVYYDAASNKLRCYNGSFWNDLF